MNQRAISTPAGSAMSLSSVARILWQWCRAGHERYRQRHFLAQLDARGLQDIGITRCEAMMELEKPFWRA